MKILFLIRDTHSSSARLRVEQYLPYIKNAGISARIEDISPGIRRRFILFTSARNFDLVFLQKKLLQKWQLEYLRRFSKKLIFDFDDAIMYKDSNSSIQISYSLERKFKAVIKKADLIITGNEYLKEKALKYNKNVVILNTPVDTDFYYQKDYHIKTNILTLGWIGSKSTLIYLKDLLPVFEKLSARFDNLQLKIVCNDFFDCSTMSIVKKQWNFEEEVLDLHSFDIGLAPLRNDIFTKGKCGYKILQYMACGLPVVCSPVGINSEIVDEGINGFYAVTIEEWVEKLSCLIKHPSLRQEFGQAGRLKAEKIFSLKVNGPKFINILMNRIHG